MVFQQEGPILGELNPDRVPVVPLSGNQIKSNCIPASSFFLNHLFYSPPEIIHIIFALEWKRSQNQDGLSFVHIPFIAFGQSYWSEDLGNFLSLALKSSNASD